MDVCLWENTNLKTQKGFMEGPPTPLAVHLTRRMPPLMEEAGVLLLSKEKTINIRISHPTQEGQREAE